MLGLQKHISIHPKRFVPEVIARKQKDNTLSWPEVLARYLEMYVTRGIVCEPNPTGTLLFDFCLQSMGNGLLQ
jgi:hypothetical protein